MAKHKKGKAKTIVDLRKHAKKRALERYGLTLNKEGYDECVKQIQLGKSEPLMKQSHTRSLHRIKYKEVPAVVVYDMKRHGIVTFLPKDTDIYKDLPDDNLC